MVRIANIFVQVLISDLSYYNLSNADWGKLIKFIQNIVDKMISLVML